MSFEQKDYEASIGVVKGAYKYVFAKKIEAFFLRKSFVSKELCSFSHFCKLALFFRLFWGAAFS